MRARGKGVPVRDAIKAITENSTVSFSVLMGVGGAILFGYNLILNTKFQADTVSLAEAKLEERVSRVEQAQSDSQSIKTDIAVIKANIENIQKNLQATQGRK
jgi:hypothetical protein